MIFIILLSFVGTLMIALATDKMAFIGFIICIITSIAWVLKGVALQDLDIIFQFLGYTVVNIIGIVMYWRKLHEKRNDQPK